MGYPIKWKHYYSYVLMLTLILAVFAGCTDVQNISPDESNTINKVQTVSPNSASRSQGTLTFTVPGSGGEGTLVRNKNGISVQIHATGLNPGNAYTAWFIVIEPGAPSPIVLNAAGNLVGGSGNSTFAGSLSTGPIGTPNGKDILNDGDGNFNQPMNSVVIIHIVDHGSAEPGTIPENIHEITGAVGLSQEYVFAP